MLNFLQNSLSLNNKLEFEVFSQRCNPLFRIRNESLLNSLKLKLTTNVHSKSTPNLFPKTTPNPGKIQKINSVETDSIVRLSTLLGENIPTKSAKVSFCDQTRQKNKTICSCVMGPVQSSQYEILDLMALVFNVQICLFGIDEFGGIFKQIKFGNNDSEFVVFLAQVFRLDSKFIKFRSILCELLNKSKESKNKKSPKFILKIQDQLRRIENIFSDHNNYFFSVLRVLENKNEKKPSETDFAWKTQATIKANLYNSFFKKIGKKPNSPFSTLKSNFKKKLGIPVKSPPQKFRLNLGVRKSLRELVVLSFTESECAHRVTCKRLRNSNLDLNWPTKRVVWFSCFAHFRKRVNRLFLDFRRDRMDDLDKQKCKNKFSRLVYKELEKRKYRKQSKRDFVVKFGDFNVQGSGEFENMFRNANAPRHKIFTSLLKSKWFKKKRTGAVHVRIPEKKSQSGDTSSDMAKEAQKLKLSSGLNENDPSEGQNEPIRMGKSTCKKRILESKLTVKALLDQLGSGEQKVQNYQKKLFNMMCKKEEKKPKSASNQKKGKVGKRQLGKQMYPNWTIPVDQSRMDTFKEGLEEPVKCAGFDRFPVSIFDESCSKTLEKS